MQRIYTVDVRDEDVPPMTCPQIASFVEANYYTGNWDTPKRAWYIHIHRDESGSVGCLREVDIKYVLVNTSADDQGYPDMAFYDVVIEDAVDGEELERSGYRIDLRA